MPLLGWNNLYKRSTFKSHVPAKLPQPQDAQPFAQHHAFRPPKCYHSS
jgi:hypothetical protein